MSTKRYAALTLAAFAAIAVPQIAGAHATYNISGYGSGLAGSTNGADGSPTSPIPPAEWTNGGADDYVGALPVQWYAGMHSAVDVRTIQTGVAPSPPSGSLLEQTDSYNALNDPDLPTDRVLAVGGLSWSDPGNGDDGWGHGLDFGLIHYSPVETLLEDGPLNFTVTLADDPTDAVAVRLAFAVYGHWDTTGTSIRHQTFVTSPTPVDDPLGATGLVLLDYAVATAAGRTISRTFELTTTYGGEYSVFVGALGGVAGRYQLTVSTAPGASSAALEQCEADLAAATSDTDADGIVDATDFCPATAPAELVDALGCAKPEFCSGFNATTKDGAKDCKRADWDNDEPTMSLSKNKGEIDCIVDKGVSGAADDVCVTFTP